MSQKINKAQLLTLLSVVPDNSDFELPSGKTVALRGVSVKEYLLHVVGRFESQQRDFIEPLEIAKSLGSTAQTSDEIEAAIIGKIDLAKRVKSSIEDGVSVQAAIIAIGLGFPGDREVEKIAVQMSDEDFDALLDEVQRRTWGDDPSPFFARVAQKIFQNHAQ